MLLRNLRTTNLSRPLTRDIFNKNQTRNVSGFSKSVDQFIDLNLGRSKNLNIGKLIQIKDNLDKLNTITEDAIGKSLTPYLKKVGSLNQSVLDTAIYTGQGLKMSPRSFPWHINLGNIPEYTGTPKTVDIHLVKNLILESVNRNKPLMFEDRCTANGVDLIHLMTEFHDHSIPVFGVGSDINVPNLTLAMALSSKLDADDILRFGYGSSFGLSPPLSNVTKVITAFNLLSVLSISEGEQVIDLASKSMNSGDVLVLCVPMASDSLLKSSTQNGWIVDTREEGITSFKQTFEYPIAMFERVAVSSKLMGEGFHFDQELSSEPFSLNDKATQQYTLYSTWWIESKTEKIWVYN